MQAKRLKFMIVWPDPYVEALFQNAGYISVTNDPDFLVFPGGADVTPALYDEKPHALTYSDQLRDMTELGMFFQYQHLPKIGICRGYQFLAVCSGDKLVQHIEGHGRNHQVMYVDKEDDFPNNRDSSGHLFYVSSTHHQCVVPNNMIELFSAGDVSEGGWCPDTLSFGVQFHPEYGTCSKEARQLFLSLVEEFLGNA